MPIQTKEKLRTLESFLKFSVFLIKKKHVLKNRRKVKKNKLLMNQGEKVKKSSGGIKE